MNLLDGATRVYAVLGSPIGHSLSPQMHNAAFRALGLNAVYVPFAVVPENLPVALEAMARMGVGGVNLTIPLKETAFALLPVDRLDVEARRFSAVNTIVFEPDGPRGFNTDGIGFLRDLREALDCSPQDRAVMILGCGGAGRAIAIASAADGARRVLLANRTADRARRVLRDVRRIVPDAVVEVLPTDPEAWTVAARDCDLVVQCSASGMRADDPPLLPTDAFRAGQAVYDLVYVAPVSPLMRSAAAGGAAVANGLGMLLHQGAAAFTLWTGLAPDLDLMRSVLEKALYGAGRECVNGNA